MGPETNRQWLCDTPVRSDVERKLRKLLIDLGNAGKILGVQVYFMTLFMSLIVLNIVESNCGLRNSMAVRSPLLTS